MTTLITSETIKWLDSYSIYIIIQINNQIANQRHKVSFQTKDGFAFHPMEFHPSVSRKNVRHRVPSQTKHGLENHII